MSVDLSRVLEDAPRSNAWIRSATAMEGSFHSVAAGHAEEQPGQKAIFVASRRPSILDQHAPHIPIALVSAPGLPLTRAFAITRTQARRASHMARARKTAHVGTKFREQSPGRCFLHSGNGAQAANQIPMGSHAFADTLLPRIQLRIQGGDLFQQFLQ